MHKSTRLQTLFWVLIVPVLVSSDVDVDALCAVYE
jgi:hypothetical protein